jgi:hypothetical protein
MLLRLLTEVVIEGLGGSMVLVTEKTDPKTDAFVCRPPSCQFYIPNALASHSDIARRLMGADEAKVRR